MGEKYEGGFPVREPRHAGTPVSRASWREPSNRPPPLLAVGGGGTSAEPDLLFGAQGRGGPGPGGPAGGQQRPQGGDEHSAECEREQLGRVVDGDDGTGEAEPPLSPIAGMTQP
jgi:hypothetical protein